MSHVFISYSRKDIEFAGKIVQALADNGLDTWIDWESIPKGEDWWREIQSGIEGADAFLFLISPDSIASKVCNDELNHAGKNGKRILPIIIRNPEMEKVPEVLSKLNWIFLRDGQDDFGKAIQEVNETIHTDYEWLKFHTELQVKALKWQRSEGEKSLLLRGKELEGAESMLGLKAGLEPQPVDLQREYLLRSRQDVTRQRRQLTIGLGFGLAIMTILAVFAWSQRNNAVQQARISQARELLAISLTVPDSLPQRRLLLAIEALNRLEESDPRIPNLETILRKYLSEFTVPIRVSHSEEQWLTKSTNDYSHQSINGRWQAKLTGETIEILDMQTHTVTHITLEAIQPEAS